MGKFKIVLIILVLGLIGLGIMSSNDNKTNEPEQVKIDVMDMTEAFTVKDCKELCDKYDLQMQTTVCNSGCYNIGKEGSALDSWCLGLIELFNEEE